MLIIIIIVIKTILTLLFEILLACCSHVPAHFCNVLLIVLPVLCKRAHLFLGLQQASGMSYLLFKTKISKKIPRKLLLPPVKNKYPVPSLDHVNLRPRKRGIRNCGHCSTDAEGEHWSWSLFTPNQDTFNHSGTRNGRTSARGLLPTLCLVDICLPHEGKFQVWHWTEKALGRSLGSLFRDYAFIPSKILETVLLLCVQELFWWLF